MRILLTIVAAGLLATASQAAVKPKPWSWTTATAVRELARANIQPFGSQYEGKVAVTRCAGKGKPVAKRYVSFVCASTFTPRGIGETPKPVTLFVRVRANGTGQPCVSLSSLARVPAACLNPKGVRVRGDTEAATIALRTTLQQTMGLPNLYQGPSECAAFGASYFECWFGMNERDDPAAGHATVTLLREPVVTILNLPAAG